MPRYRATIQIQGVDADTPAAARGALEERLRRGGLENCRVVSLDPEAGPGRPIARRVAVPSNPHGGWRRDSNAGGLLLVAAAAWAIWFFWWMLSNGIE